MQVLLPPVRYYLTMVWEMEPVGKFSIESVYFLYPHCTFAPNAKPETDMNDIELV